MTLIKKMKWSDYKLIVSCQRASDKIMLYLFYILFRHIEIVFKSCTSGSRSSSNVREGRHMFSDKSVFFFQTGPKAQDAFTFPPFGPF